jgi:hypothetical protein
VGRIEASSWVSEAERIHLKDVMECGVVGGDVGFVGVLVREAEGCWVGLG